MADFLEERISSLIRYGSGWQDDYAVNIVTTSGGQEFRSLTHPYPVRRFDVSYLLETDAAYNELLAIYHRAHGKFAGFRARCFDEWSSNGRTGVPTALDQEMLLVSAGVYQLRKFYGTDKAAGASGYAFRQIKKPVSGTVKVGISGIEVDDHSVDATTGRVSFNANRSANIVGISKASQAVLTLQFAHPYLIGDTVHVSAVSGMTEINGLRASVIFIAPFAITVDIDTTGFSTWTSGGIVNTRPQSGESVTAGFEFDFPVRFNTTLPVGQDHPRHRAVEGVELIELLNP